MNTKTYSFLLLLAVLTIASCKKQNTVPTDGIYRGVFSRIYGTADTSGTGIAFLSFSQTYSTYIIKGDTSSGVPINCSGKYTLIGTNQIEFRNTAALSGTIDDPLFVLDTIYTYVFQDSTFLLTLALDDVKYEYNLRRY